MIKSTLDKVKIVEEKLDNKGETKIEKQTDKRMPLCDLFNRNYTKLCGVEQKLFELYDKKRLAEGKIDKSKAAMKDKLSIGITAVGSWICGDGLSFVVTNNHNFLDAGNVLGGCAVAVIMLGAYIEYYSSNKRFYKNYTEVLQGQIDKLQQEREVLRNENETNLQLL